MLSMYFDNKREILGQYFTKEKSVLDMLKVMFDYVQYDKTASILEPSSGTGNFVVGLKSFGYNNISECEIDDELTDSPADFFEMSIDRKFDLIIGNPPFTKYNLIDSYYHILRYKNSDVSPNSYLKNLRSKVDKIKIENAFIYKSIIHLRNESSSIGFVLPISFFIKNKNKDLKKYIKQKFSTIIIYQNQDIWFDRNIPCCFVVMTNRIQYNNQIIVIYENDKKNIYNMDISNIYEEIIPLTIFNKNSDVLDNNKGTSLDYFLTKNSVKIQKSFKSNNISAKNILSKTTVSDGDADISDYKLAIVRVGNSSVGKCGLVNIKTDILNDMFYVFDFKDEYSFNKDIKEEICRKINLKNNYFKNISCRIGSKSIKKDDVFNLKI